MFGVIMSREMSFLIVDNNMDILEIIKTHILLYLSRSQIDVATNGYIALEKMKKFKYDFLITDFKMPVMDGLTLVKRAKQLENEHCPKSILMVSGYLEPGNPGPEIQYLSCIPKNQIIHKLPEYIDYQCMKQEAIASKKINDSLWVYPSEEAPILVDVIEDCGAVDEMTVKDISQSGVNLNPSYKFQNYPIGHSVSFVLALPQVTPMEMEGTIVHIHRAETIEPAIGIKFAKPKRKQRKIIASYIKNQLERMS